MSGMERTYERSSEFALSCSYNLARNRKANLLSAPGVKCNAETTGEANCSKLQIRTINKVS